MMHATNNEEESSIYLAYAFQLSMILLLVGDLSTYLFRIPVNICLLCFTCIALTVYAAACGFKVGL